MQSVFSLRAVAAAALTLLCMTTGSANAALFEDDEARKAILDLRQRVEAIRQNQDSTDQRKDAELRRLSEDNAQLRRSLLDLQNQIDTTKQELAKVRGTDEQMARDLAEVQRRQKDLASGMDDRFKKFEPTKVSVDGREFQAEPAEKRDFDTALATFRRGEFTPAQAQFFDFLKRYPASGYGPTALFWLGNAQYATRDYKEAVANFRALVSQAADHPRAAEALLSIANCHAELKDNKAARRVLDELVKNYPQTEAAATAKERLSRLK